MCSIWANTLRIQKNCVAILPRAKTGYLIVLFSYAKRVTQKYYLSKFPRTIPTYFCIPPTWIMKIIIYPILFAFSNIHEHYDELLPAKH